MTPRERVQVGTLSRRTPGCGQSHLGQCSRLQGTCAALSLPTSGPPGLMAACCGPSHLGTCFSLWRPSWGLSIGVVSPGKGVPGLPYLPTWSRGYF